MALLECVGGTIRRCALARAGTRVLVALSGGADSVALLFLLRELAARGEVTLAGAAHLNHLLRGQEADADEAFCAALAARLGLPFDAERVDVAALARVERRSIEDAGRRARYAFLERAASRLGADAIAVAHTEDDQAETFLLRVLRGAGARGLGGIHPRVGRVIRPLLDVSRVELRDYLDALGEPFREDPSNADVGVPRNRVRHELIPYLQSRFLPAITAVLAREAMLARQDDDLLHAQAIEMGRRIVLTDSAVDRGAGSVAGPEVPGVLVRIDAAALRAAHPALSSRVAHDVLSRFAGRRSITLDHVDRVLALAAGGREGSVIGLPGQHAERVGDTIVLRAGRADKRAANSFCVSLSIPGEVRLPNGWTVAADELPGPDRRLSDWTSRGPEVGVAAAAVALPLAVRSRRPGDRFRPLGAPGVRKLQDFLVDRKVPRSERDTLPLVVDGRNRIVWVAGQAVGEDFRVSDPSQGVILLKVKRLGGPG